MKKIDSFIALSILSRAGNACADYAFVWLSLYLFSAAGTEGAGTRLLSVVYVGQALGVIFLTPVLAHAFDRSQRRMFAVGIDLAYALTLIGAIFLYSVDLLNSPTTFLLVALMSALGLVHSSSVTMYALQELGQNQDRSKLGSKFALLGSLSYLAGALISGLVFSYFGFTGCLWLAVLTFIPITVGYFHFFDSKKQEAPAELQASVWALPLRGFRSGLSQLFSDRLLFKFSLLLALINIAASVLPGVTSLGLESSLGHRPDVYSYVIGFGILMGIVSIGVVRRIVVDLRLSHIIPSFYVLLCIALGLCYLLPPLWGFSLMFAVNCIASAAVNITSGALRTARIASGNIGTVNTGISLMLFSGQLLGGLLLIPIAGESLSISLAVIITLFLSVSFISWRSLPTTQLKEIL